MVQQKCSGDRNQAAKNTPFTQAPKREIGREDETRFGGTLRTKTFTITEPYSLALLSYLRREERARPLPPAQLGGGLEPPSAEKSSGWPPHRFAPTGRQKAGGLQACSPCPIPASVFLALFSAALIKTIFLFGTLIMFLGHNTEHLLQVLTGVIH